MLYANLSEDKTKRMEHGFRKAAAARLAQIVARVVRGGDRAPGELPHFKAHVRHGDPRAVLKAAVLELETDLLLLGTHGYTGAAHVFLGTVAGDILRDVRCDVLVVPPRRSPGRHG